MLNAHGINFLHPAIVPSDVAAAEDLVANDRKASSGISTTIGQRGTIGPIMSYGFICVVSYKLSGEYAVFFQNRRRYTA